MYDKSLFFNVFERSDEFFFLFKKTLSKAKHEYKKIQRQRHLDLLF